MDKNTDDRKLVQSQQAFAIRLIRVLLFVLLLAFLPFRISFECSANEETPSKQKGIIRFNQNDWMSGELLSIENENRILWNCPDFVAPLDIRLNDIWQLTNSTELAIPVDYPPSTVRVILEEGDLVYGRLISRSDDGLEVSTSSLGTVYIRNDKWLRIESLVDAETGAGDSSRIPSSIRSLATQMDSSQIIPGWDRGPDGLVTNRRAATIRSDFGLKDRYRVDLRLAWQGKPSFDIALGIDPSEPSASTAVHLEVWDGALVLAMQQDGKADASMIKSLVNAENDNQTPMIDISVFHDAKTGITYATDIKGNQLARIQLPASRPRKCTGIQVVNHGEKLRIESIRSSYWPPEEQNSVTINTNRRPAASDDKRLNSIEALPQLSFKDGCRLSGRLVSNQDGKIALNANALRDALAITVKSIHRISSGYPADQEKQLQASYKLDGLNCQMQVDLASFQRTKEIELLSIKSHHLNSPATLSSRSKGEVFRISKPVKSDADNAKKSGIGGVVGMTSKNTTRVNSDPDLVYRIPNAIQLRSGETIQGQVTSIDEEGLHYSSSLTDSTVLKPHELLSIYLHPRKYPLAVDSEKMQRLMTIPRDQVESIPSHLVVTTGGDYLRGNVMQLNDNYLELAQGEGMLKIPSRNVSAVIWLTQAESGPAAAERNKINPAESSLQNDSGRSDPKPKGIQPSVAIDYLAETSSTEGSVKIKIDSIRSGTIQGTSDVLGSIELQESNISIIRFGENGLSQKLKTNPWLLHVAKAPKILGEDSPEGSGKTRNPGETSPLVNAQAPLFQLKNLDGEWVRLERYRGKVVVLDFWASWCGPCMVSLPELSRLAKSVGDAQCQWIGVNLQENKDQIERVAYELDSGSLILLDSDGLVANQYKVESIPMVIVIAPNGIVQSVFIGSDRSRLAEIEQSIRSCLTPK